MALQSELLERGGPELGYVAFDDVPSLRLGAVHRRVGALQQALGRRRVGGVQADAEARRDEYLLPLEADRSLDRGHDALRHQDGVLRHTDVGTQHGELVAPEPRHRVLSADRRSDTLGHRLQERVAGCMAKRVVDHLESVEVEEQHRDDALRPLGPVERHPHLIEEQLSVGQPRERVVIGDLLDLGRGVHRRLPLLLEEPDDEPHRQPEIEHDVDEAERREPQRVQRPDVRIGRQREVLDLVRRQPEEGERHGAAADGARDPRGAADRPSRHERGERHEDPPQRHAELIDQLGIGRVPPEEHRQQTAKQGGRDDDASHRRPRQRGARRQLEGSHQQERELKASSDARQHRDHRVRRIGDRPAGRPIQDDARQRAARGVRREGEPAPRPMTEEGAPVAALQPDEHEGDEQRRASLHQQAGDGQEQRQRHPVIERKLTDVGEARACRIKTIDDHTRAPGDAHRCVGTVPPPKVGARRLRRALPACATLHAIHRQTTTHP